MPTGPELTVDQLAARAGLTVRNVRAYAARGLLPPPRLRGRTGYYGEEHLERLALVREMLAEGFTLARIESVLAGGTGAATGSALSLHRTLMAPWLPEAPEETDVATLIARTGAPADAGTLDALVELGVVERLDGDRLRVLDPTLLAVGVQVVRLGVPPRAVVAAQQEVLGLAEQAADVYVRMFLDTVWRDFTDAGAPAQDWPRLQEVVETLQPVAAQALLAAFRTAMATAVARTLHAEVARVAPSPEEPPARDAG